MASAPGTPDLDLIAAYKARYRDFFGAGALAGLTVGVYQHSSVARDVIVEMLEALGARAVPLGRATSFIPVDTEALREEDEVLARQWAGEQTLDAIVSTDGDADRPLISDATRRLPARRPGWGDHGQVSRGGCDRHARDLQLRPGGVRRLRQKSFAPGSDHLTSLRAWRRPPAPGPRPLSGSKPMAASCSAPTSGVSDRRLAALPTRDAMLPILCALGEIVAQGKPLAEIGAAFAFKAAASNRLQNVATDKSAAFVARLQQDEAFLSELMAPLGGVAEVNSRDGLRIMAKNGEVVHFRPSGNAPELRVYVEAATQERTDDLLGWGLALAQRQVG